MLEKKNHEWSDPTGKDLWFGNLSQAVMGSKIFRRSNSHPSLKWSSIVENLFIVQLSL